MGLDLSEERQQAHAYLDQLPPAQLSLAETGTGNIKRLQGIDPPGFRLRVGDFRIFFGEEPSGTLQIRAVKNRREAYR